MKAYREIDSSKRTPPERTEVHVINNGLLTSGYIQDGQWYLGEHETAVLKFDGVWLEEYASQSEPNTVTEEELQQDFRDWLGWNDQDSPDQDDPDYYTYSWGMNVWCNAYRAYKTPGGGGE